MLEAGKQVGVVPELEVWGFSKNLGHLSECVAVAMETGHRNACVLPDVFHLYKGGSDFHGIRLLGPEAIQVLHMNDYPADPPRVKECAENIVKESDRVAVIVRNLLALQALDAVWRGVTRK